MYLTDTEISIYIFETIKNTLSNMIIYNVQHIYSQFSKTGKQKQVGVYTLMSPLSID